jgi:hypothetical protein
MHRRHDILVTVCQRMYSFNTPVFWDVILLSLSGLPTFRRNLDNVLVVAVGGKPSHILSIISFIIVFLQAVAYIYYYNICFCIILIRNLSR